MRILLIILSIFLASTLFAQPTLQWHSRVYHPLVHHDDGIFIEEGPNGSLISFALEKTDQSQAQLMVTEIDKCGLNLKKYVTSGLDFDPKWLLNTAQDSKENIYVAGLMDSIMPYGTPFVLKLSPQLNVIWLKTYPTDEGTYPYSFAINNQDEVFLMFNTNRQPLGNSLLKLKNNGDIIWAKSFGFTGLWGKGGPTSDGGFFHSTGSTLFKTDAFGNMEWRTHVQGAYNMTAPLEIDGGYLFFQGYPNSSRANRLVMLNYNGSLRWVSDQLNNFNGLFFKKLSPTEALLVGEGYSNHPSSPGIRSICFLTINTLVGDVISQKGIYKQAEALYRYGFDFLTTSNNKDFLVEKKINSLGIHQTSFTKLPSNLDSLSCLQTFEFSPPDNSTYTVQSLSTINALDINFSINNLNAVVNFQQSEPLNQLCSNTPAAVDFTLGNDTLLCPTEHLTLRGPDFHQYLWSTGETTQNIRVDKEGWYGLRTSTPCGDTYKYDSIFIAYNPVINPYASGVEESYFTNGTLYSEAFSGFNGTYFWYVNDVLIDSGNTFNFICDSAGVFNLTLVFIDHDGCSFSTEYRYRVHDETPSMPNVFTPNGDGRNERFTPFQSEGARYKLEIYNRNGTLLSENKNRGWDGKTNKGRSVASGVYFYLLYWENNPEPIKGFVTVIK